MGNMCLRFTRGMDVCGMYMICKFLQSNRLSQSGWWVRMEEKRNCYGINRGEARTKDDAVMTGPERSDKWVHS
jgi:hypothetical protein